MHKIAVVTFILFFNFSLEAKLDLSKLQKNSFEKMDCSPSLENKKQSGIEIYVPSTINWGEKLPVCGFLKNPEPILGLNNLGAFSLEIQHKKSQEFFHDNANFQLGNPPLHQDEIALQKLTAKKELYFNGLGQSQYSILAPGEYTITMTYHKMRSSIKTLNVVPAGALKELSDFLIGKICNGSLLKDFRSYIDQEQQFSTMDIGSDPQSIAAYKKMQREHKENWIKIYKKNYETKLQRIWKDELNRLPKEDQSLITYIKSEIPKVCPKTKIDDTETTYLLAPFIRLNK